MPSLEAADAPPLSTWQAVAMASRITIQAPPGSPGLEQAVLAAFGAFERVERDCTRFGTTGPLVRANRRPGRWHRVPPTLFAALQEARRAHRLTGGLFDPRIHDTLVRLGYDRSFSEMSGGEVAGPAPGARAPVPRRAAAAGAWRPRFVPIARLVHLGGSAADLGGIGKGLALRDAARLLRRGVGDFLIEAGGDVYAAGEPRPGSAWSIGVESPLGDDGPAAVIEVQDRAVATSSTRVRRWSSAGKQVHHLIDPHTGSPGGGSLRSVTVVERDPAIAEVWSKALFLQGPGRIGAAAEARRLAALWIDSAGRIGVSGAMKPHVAWVSR